MKIPQQPLRIRQLMIGAGLAAALLAGSSRSQARGPAIAGPQLSFTVNSVGDQPDANPGDGVCDVGNGGCTLRAAIQEANARAGIDQITIQPGVYHLNRNGRNEDDGLTGDLDVHESVTIVGESARLTIVDGGAVDRMLDLHAGDLTLRDLTLTNGDAGDGNGGAIRQAAETTLTLDTISITESRAANGGGLATAGELAVTHSTLADNVATASGGAVYSTARPEQAIDNSTISGNRADTDGGGLYFDPPPDPFGAAIRLAHVTIAFNAADADQSDSGNGGGIYQRSGDVILANSALSDNVVGNPDPGGETEPRDCRGVLTVEGRSLVSVETLNCQVVGPLEGSVLGQSAQLEPLGEVGGQTDTHLPRVGSPAIDRADPALCPDDDQRNQRRPQDGDYDGRAFCDIGAVELVPPAASPTPSATASATPTATTPSSPTPTATTTPTVTLTPTATTTSALPSPTATPTARPSPTTTPSPTATATTPATATTTTTPSATSSPTATPPPAIYLPFAWQDQR